MTSGRVGPSAFRYHLVRLALKVATAAYVRTSVSGQERLPPTGAYIVCFNHPSWLDPIFFAAWWPDRTRRLFIFGPREQDMRTGIRNRAITWTGRGVPFKPGAQDILEVTRRAVAVLDSGACLVIAGEGRLSDLEGVVRPLETGLAHFSRLSGAPIVPAAIIGSRWVHFGSRVRISIGEPVYPADYGGGRIGAHAMTDEVQARLQALLAGVEEREPPGWLGRTISEAFNERPWLEDEEPRS